METAVGKKLLFQINYSLNVLGGMKRGDEKLEFNGFWSFLQDELNLI